MSVSKESRSVRIAETPTSSANTAKTVQYRRLANRARRCRSERSIRSTDLSAEQQTAEAHEVFDAGVAGDHQGYPERDRGEMAELAELVIDDEERDRDDLHDRLDLAPDARRNHQVLRRGEAAQRGDGELARDDHHDDP